MGKESDVKSITMGTPIYMAPEMLFIFNDNEEIGENKELIDLWSIGVSFFKMLFGENPFKGKSIND